MAISGGSTALVLAGARKMGVPYEDLAEYTNVTTGKVGAAASITASDQTSQKGRLAWTGLEGIVRVYWGDGVVSKAEATLVAGYVEHTYTGAATYHVVVVASGVTMKATLVIA
jgi:hypothetical protein